MSAHWDEIGREVKSAIENLPPERLAYRRGRPITASLAGSPLQPRRIAVLGINWGGEGARDETQRDSWGREPTGCELAKSIGSGFASQLQGIFSKCDARFDEKFIEQNIFYSNRILIRTNQEREHERLLADFAEVSARALKGMLGIVRPKVILCFGCSNTVRSPSRFILKDLAGLTDWQTQGIHFAIKRGSRSGVGRFFKSILLDVGERPLVASVWSLPHPARWSSQIENATMLMAAMRDSLN